jgi:hypothetical protein
VVGKQPLAFSHWHLAQLKPTGIVLAKGQELKANG